MDKCLHGHSGQDQISSSKSMTQYRSKIALKDCDKDI